MKGDRKIARFTHQLQGRIDTLVSRIALGTGSQIHRSFRQRDAPFGPTYLHHGIESGICQKQGIGIGRSNPLWSFSLYNEAYEEEADISLDTVKTLKECKDVELVDKFEEARLDRYEEIAHFNPSKSKYLRGWENRVRNAEKFADRELLA